MRAWWIVGWLGIGAAVGCDGGGDPVDDTDTPSETEPVDPEDMPGAPIYAAQCALCHGADGEGGTGPQLAGLIPNVPTLINLITTGTGSMPSFEGTLTEQEIEDVAEYAFARFVP